MGVGFYIEKCAYYIRAIEMAIAQLCRATWTGFSAKCRILGACLLKYILNKNFQENSKENHSGNLI